MLLRSGKLLENTSYSRYNEFKKRTMIIYHFEQVNYVQCKFMKDKLSTWNNTIKPQNVNELFICILNIPEIIACNPPLRNMIQKRLNEIMNHQSFIHSIDKDILKAIKNYFNWLKKRSDYEDDAKIVMKRVNDRARVIRQELIEILYHPDRYERMTAKYGEIWADIHLPY